MSASHTKGPWEASDRGDYDDFDGDSRVILGDDMRVAVVHDRGTQEADANARLIAAAPDMLEALEAWRAWSDFEADEPIHESNEDRADWRAEASELYDKAYNLTTPSVAKAKGEQS